MKTSPVTRIAALLMAFSATVIAAPAISPPLPGSSVYQLPITLVDQHGHAGDWRLRRGRPQVVAMFYSSCKFTCPLIVESGKAVQKQLSPVERAGLQILLISIDPKRDTPEVLAALARQRHLDDRQWTLASPASKDVRSIAGLLGIRYRELAGGDFNHTSELILLDAEGRILARTGKIGSIADPEFMAAVRRAVPG